MTKPETKKYSLSEFFTAYLDNLGSLTLVNLIFGVITAAEGALLLLASYLTGSINVFVMLFIIPLSSPFFAGLFYISRRLTLKEELHPVHDFFSGVRNNFIRFFVDSFIVYIIVSGLYFTFSFYRSGLDSPLKILAFIMSIIFTIFFFSVESALLTMFVSVDVGIPETVKNSVVLFLGGFVNHMKTVLSLLLVFSVLFTAVQLSGNLILAIVFVGVPYLLLLPVFCVYIIVFNNWQTVEKLVVEPFREEHKAEMRKKEKEEQLEQAADDTDTDELIALAEGDPEEYVYVSGRMIKRKNVKKMLEKNH